MMKAAESASRMVSLSVSTSAALKALTSDRVMETLTVQSSGKCSAD
jgi:hypothetical protein